jgi:hypothetical protein
MNCQHPDPVVVEDECTFLRWCPACGSVCNNNDVPGLRAGEWRAPSGILLPGWTCGACGTFNGSGKELLEACRHCERPRRKS